MRNRTLMHKDGADWQNLEVLEVKVPVCNALFVMQFKKKKKKLN